MQAQYENQGGLLVNPATSECAGYIYNFTGHGAYGPEKKVETTEGNPTQAEIDAHNAILAKAELEHMATAGSGTFYVHQAPWIPMPNGERIRSLSSAENYVSLWTGNWKAHAFIREGYSYGFCRVKTRWIWFIGPDGKKWYGVNKGDMDCFTGKRLKNQK